MNKALVLVIFNLLTIACTSGESNHKDSSISTSKNQVVIDTCRAFVDNFPSTFKEFNDVYGYDDINGKGPLYEKYEQHINNYFNCDQVSAHRKLNKSIKIGVGGKWDADAIGLLQQKTLELIKANPQEALIVLNALSDKDASSVWYFLFDGPHPTDKENIESVNYLSELLGADNKQTKLLRKEFEKLKSGESH